MTIGSKKCTTSEGHVTSLCRSVGRSVAAFKEKGGCGGGGGGGRLGWLDSFDGSLGFFLYGVVFRSIV